MSGINLDPFIEYSEDALIVSPLDWNRLRAYLRGVTNVSSEYYINEDTSRLICASTAGAAFPIILPQAAAYPGIEYEIIKVDTGTNLLTVAALFNNLINGTATYLQINAQYKWVRVKSISSKWIIIGAG